MNIIKCIAWRDCNYLYNTWSPQENNEIKSKYYNTEKLFIDTEVIKGKTRKRTLGYIKEDPSDETTTNNIIGAVAILAKDFNEVKIGGLANLTVDPLYRGNNIAYQLVDICLTYMRQADFDLVMVPNDSYKVLSLLDFKVLENNIYIKELRKVPNLDANILFNNIKKMNILK